MKVICFYISVAASALCLVLSIILSVVGGVNQNLQNDVQKQQVDLQTQQQEINKGVEIQQKVGPNLLNDMAVVSVNDEGMKKLLGKYGYNVKVQATPAPGDAKPARTTPAPAPAAETPALRP